MPSTLSGAVRVGPHSQARLGALLRIVPHLRQRAQLIAWPGGTAIKLTPDAVRRLGVDFASLSPVCAGIDKSHLKVRAMDRPLVLRWVISLYRECVPESELLTPSAALAVVIEQTFRRHYMRALGVERQHLAMALQVAAACRCATLSGYRGVKAAADLLERIVGGDVMTKLRPRARRG